MMRVFGLYSSGSGWGLAVGSH